MPGHIFLQERVIGDADLWEVLDLTSTGQLEFGHVGDNVAAIGSNVDYSMGVGYAADHNFTEVRIGFVPEEDGLGFNYVRLAGLGGEHYYVDNFPNEPLLELGRRVMQVGQFAVEAVGGRLSSIVQPCQGCERETGHMRSYSAVHGIRGAVAVGSEKLECACCATKTVDSEA